MKTKIFRVISFFMVALLLTSCGGGGAKLTPVTLYPYETSNGDGYFDVQGKIAINPQFYHSTVFRNGLALVGILQDFKWGFIDEEGKYVIDPKYIDATVFSEGLAWVVEKNSTPTAIDNKGKVKITLQNAEYVKIFSEGMAAYSVKDAEGNLKWGFVDKKGTVKIDPQFIEVGNFSDGKCAVNNAEAKWGYIDKKGTLVINHQFGDAYEFHDGIAVVKFNYKDGLIDEDGKYLVNPQFSEMVYDNGLYRIKQDYKYGWCDKTGKIIINPQFEDALFFAGNDLAPISIGEKYGYIDKEGKIIINPQFEEGAFIFNDGRALVVMGEKIGLIDETGKFVTNPQYDNLPDDLFKYLEFGGTEYDYVKTDIVNLSLAK